MGNKALDKIIENLTLDKSFKALEFDAFMNEFSRVGPSILRNIYQIFHDMIHYYAYEVKDGIPFDAEAIGFLNYNFDKIFIQDTEKPFFSDRLFSKSIDSSCKEFSSQRDAKQDLCFPRTRWKRKKHFSE